MKLLEEDRNISKKGRADLVASGQGIQSLTGPRGMRDPTPGQGGHLWPR